ncbi:hypothetical protein [Sabulicella glaciei]|uniref:HD domain-containing protein n=1 Tax=Sabulicella glaciei TaxID=2984948 RepID=A0ABT3NU73_9PROT|nr:hypothetical protein [Roseococcus sp. MDT2-1-1]MCW8085699.1 hypothetical protein [Roseococcus sp. MDT2-1-1]
MTGPADLLPLLRELGDLKRVRSAGREGSVAQRLFARAWAALCAGAPPEAVAHATTRAALSASRLGDLDDAAMMKVGIPPEARAAIMREAISSVSAAVDPGLLRAMAEAPELPAGPPPPFVALLAAQPRAGATCPGRGRLMFEPPENHAEHCLITAVAGAVLAPAYAADTTAVFLAALSHHLHNALLPDSGFAGEMLLGNWLEPAMDSATSQALAELPEVLRAQVEVARLLLRDAETPGGRAFHAADTLDRVLQMEHHLRAAGTTIGFLLREMELVHDGPVRPFQEGLLREVGLAA